MRDKRERLRGAQADFDRISELHSERRQAAAAAVDATQQERLRSFLVRPCRPLKHVGVHAMNDCRVNST